MSNNNVIYSKTLELRSNNGEGTHTHTHDCSLGSFGGAGNKMGRAVWGEEKIDQQRSGGEKAIEISCLIPLPQR